MTNRIIKKSLLTLFVFIGYQANINIAMASGKSPTPQQILDTITSREGEVKGVVVKQTPKKVTVVEQKYGEKPVTKTYEKKTK